MPRLEQLDVRLAFSRPLVPALAAGQRHHVGAARGFDGLGIAIGKEAGGTGAVVLGHRREALHCKPPDEWGRVPF